MLAHHMQPPHGAPMQPPMPTNPEAQKVIDKVIEYLIRTPEFETKLREKEQKNPKFAFLFGGENSEYFNWRMYCARNPEQAFYPQQNYGGQQNYHAFQQPNYAAPQVPPFQSTLSLNEQNELTELLDNLNGSKESINSGKNWITHHMNHAPSIIEFIKQKISFSSDPQGSLLIVYLLNEVLVSAAKVREEKQMINDSFIPRLGFILHVAYHQAAADKKEKIEKVLAIWDKRGIFDGPVLKAIENEMRDPDVLNRQREQQKQQYPPPQPGWQQFPGNYPPPNPQFGMPNQGMINQPMGIMPPYGMVTPQTPAPPPYHPSLENVPIGVLVSQIKLQGMHPPNHPPYTPINPSLLKLPSSISPPDSKNPALIARLEEMFTSIEKVKKEHARDKEVRDSGFSRPAETKPIVQTKVDDGDEDLDGEEIDDTVMQEIAEKEKAAHIAEIEQVMGMKQDGSASMDDDSHLGLGANNNNNQQDPFEQFRRAKAFSYSNR